MVPSVVVITGPTGAGKSGFAVRLAERLGGEIINADSVQVYRGFDIGSAKPSAQELARVPHHLVSVLDPAESFDAARFTELAGSAIREIVARERIPIIVGGTGLYISALLGGLVAVSPPTAEARTAVDAREAAAGDVADVRAAALYEWLAEIDPASARVLHRGDRQRVRRALLVRLSTGHSLSELQSAHAHQGREYRGLVCSILPPRADLYRILDERVHAMLTAGFLREVEQLIAAGAGASKPMQSIGYRHLAAFIRARGADGTTVMDGPSREEALQEAVFAIQRDTRRFAKRQFTWWRHQPERLGWIVDGQSIEIVKGRRPGALEDALAGVIRGFFEKGEELAVPGVEYLPVDDFLFGDFF